MVYIWYGRALGHALACSQAKRIHTQNFKKKSTWNETKLNEWMTEWVRECEWKNLNEQWKLAINSVCYKNKNVHCSMYRSCTRTNTALLYIMLCATTNIFFKRTIYFAKNEYKRVISDDFMSTFGMCSGCFIFKRTKKSRKITKNTSSFGVINISRASLLLLPPQPPPPHMLWYRKMALIQAHEIRNTE